MEDLLPVSTPSSVASGSRASTAAGARWAWMEPVYTDQQSTSVLLAVGPRGTLALCCGS